MSVKDDLHYFPAVRADIWAGWPLSWLATVWRWENDHLHTPTCVVIVVLYNRVPLRVYHGESFSKHSVSKHYTLWTLPMKKIWDLVPNYPPSLLPPQTKNINNKKSGKLLFFNTLLYLETKHNQAKELIQVQLKQLRNFSTMERTKTMWTLVHSHYIVLVTIVKTHPRVQIPIQVNSQLVHPWTTFFPSNLFPSTSIVKGFLNLPHHCPSSILTNW